jgi:cytochrome c biogenesis protein
MGLRSFSSWFWRVLTSMRTALILLFLLALASIPGSLFPQRGSAPLRVNQYLRDNPELGKWLDRFYLFDVFASPWFGAIYLLLFISLTGCVVPRLREHLHEAKAQPPAAPKNLSRLPVGTKWSTSESTSADPLNDALSYLQSRRWRIRSSDDWISAEKGYLRETGNLLFHFALLGLLFAVGVGGALGFRGTVIVREGAGFANNITQYDSFTPGRFFDTNSLTPFSLKLTDFAAEYQRGGMQSGSARNFYADVLLTGDTNESVRIEVNKPLRVAGTSIYLVGHGYAPEFTVRDKSGEIVWQDAAIFLPQDTAFTSTGVVKAPDATPQIGIQGFFLPTVSEDFSRGPKSDFPAADDPEVYLSAWIGDLGLDTGAPQSVYRLDTTNMTRLGIEELAPGETWELPGGNGTLEFTGYREWASFSVAKDPGKVWALVMGTLAIIGVTLSLLIPRRRLWVRRSSDGTVLEVAGLAKNNMPGLDLEVEQLAQAAGKPKE